MVKLSSVHSRRLRSVAVAGLIVGATGAFFPGGHSAHAAGGVFANGSGTLCTTGTLPPAPVSAVSGSESGPGSATNVFSSGKVTLQVDGASLQFDGANNPGLNFTQTGSFNDVQATGCNETTTVASDANFSSTLVSSNGQTCNQLESIRFKVTPTAGMSMGTTQIFVTLDCNNGTTMDITGSGTVNAFGQPTGTATPELSSGELLATGLLPALGIVLYRRRRQRRAGK